MYTAKKTPWHTLNLGALGKCHAVVHDLLVWELLLWSHEHIRACLSKGQNISLRSKSVGQTRYT